MSSEWRRYRLGEVGTLVGGATPSTTVPEYWNGDIEWTTSRLLGKTVTLHKGERRVTRHGLDNSSSTLVPPGNLLVGTRVGVGKVSVTGVPIAISQDLTGILVDESRFDARYLAFYLKTSWVQADLVQRARGVTIKGVPREDLATIEVAAPPLAVQRRIAAILDQAAERVVTEDRLVATTRELKQAAMRQLFARGLEGEERKDTVIGAVPRTWEVVELGTLGQIGNGSTPKRTNPQYWTSGAIPWLTSAKVYDRVITKANEFVTSLAVSECHLPTVAPGSLLIAITGQGRTLGNVAISAIETTVSQHLAYVTIKQPRVRANFLRHYLGSRYEFLRSLGQAGGSTKGALTCAGLKAISVPIPPMSEQTAIEHVLDAIDQSLLSHERRETLLRALFDTLLNDLMAGRLRVPDILTGAERKGSVA